MSSGETAVGRNCCVVGNVVEVKGTVGVKGNHTSLGKNCGKTLHESLGRTLEYGGTSRIAGDWGGSNVILEGNWGERRDLECGL